MKQVKRALIGLVAMGLIPGVGFLFALELGRIRLEQGLSRFLHAPVHIRRLTLSPRRVVLHQVSLRAPGPFLPGGSPMPPLVMERILMEGSLWSWLNWRSPMKPGTFLKRGVVESITVTGVTLSVAGLPLQAQGRLFLSAAEAPRCEGWLTVRHPFLEGMVEVSGTVAEPILLGWIEGPHLTRRHFVGQWAVSRQELRLVHAELQGGWRLNGALQPEVTPRGQGGRLTAWFRQEDQIPERLTAEWAIRRSHLDVEMRLLGDEISLGGRIGLKPPYPVDLTLEFKGSRMEELLPWFLSRSRSAGLSGSLHGRVALRGPLNRLESQGELVGRGGVFGREPFSLATLRFQGRGPVLKIQNSQLTKPSGILLIEGTVDLRRLGRPDFFSRVRLSSMEKSLGLGGGWRVGPATSPPGEPHLPGSTPGASGLSVRRSGDETQVAVGLAYEVDAQIQSEPVTREKLEVEYPLSSKQRLNVRLDRDEEFLGVEHRRKF